MKLKKIFLQPYPLTSLSEAMKRDVRIGLFLIFFFLAFTPFGLSTFAYDRFYIIIGYGLISYLTIATIDFFGFRFATQIFNETNWKVYKQVFWELFKIVCLGFSNLTFGIMVGAFPFTLSSFIQIEFYVFASSVIPVIGNVIIRQNYLLKEHLHQAIRLNEEIQQKNVIQTNEVNTDLFISFVAENNKDYLGVNLSSVIIISAQDNYTEFILKKEGKVYKELLRSTLAKVEDTLISETFLFRCHRAYIINVRRIQSLSGNSQGYRISMEGIEESIPVARAKNKELRERIRSFSVK